MTLRFEIQAKTKPSESTGMKIDGELQVPMTPEEFEADQARLEGLVFIDMNAHLNGLSFRCRSDHFAPEHDNVIQVLSAMLQGVAQSISTNKFPDEPSEWHKKSWREIAEKPAA